MRHMAVPIQMAVGDYMAVSISVAIGAHMAVPIHMTIPIEMAVSIQVAVSIRMTIPVDVPLRCMHLRGNGGRLEVLSQAHGDALDAAQFFTRHHKRVRQLELLAKNREDFAQFD